MTSGMVFFIIPIPRVQIGIDFHSHSGKSWNEILNDHSWNGIFIPCLIPGFPGYEKKNFLTFGKIRPVSGMEWKIPFTEWKIPLQEWQFRIPFHFKLPEWKWDCIPNFCAEMGMGMVWSGFRSFHLLQGLTKNSQSGLGACGAGPTCEACRRLACFARWKCAYFFL